MDEPPDQKTKTQAGQKKNKALTLFRRHTFDSDTNPLKVKGPKGIYHATNNPKNVDWLYQHQIKKI